MRLAAESSYHQSTSPVDLIVCVCTVEPLIKDTLAKGALCKGRFLMDQPCITVAVHFYLGKRTTSL